MASIIATGMQFTATTAYSFPFFAGALLTWLFFTGCHSSPKTLVEIARERAQKSRTHISKTKQAGAGGADPQSTTLSANESSEIGYSITDLDILDYTDQLKRHLRGHFRYDRAASWATSSGQLTCGALAGSASTLGLSAATASGFATGGVYIFGLGKIFDSKGHAEAYAQAVAEIERQEARFYFDQVGLRWEKDETPLSNQSQVGGGTSASSAALKPTYHVSHSGYLPRPGVPSSDHLTRDGEYLYYRVTRTMAVLQSVIAGKIPNLQDMKDVAGETDHGR